MKRDLDYMIDLLKEIEEVENYLYLFSLTYGMDNKTQKKYLHLQLLCDAGYLVKESDASYRITNSGYDYLGVVERGGERWQKIKNKIGDQIESVCLDVVFSLGLEFMKQQFGIEG